MEYTTAIGQNIAKLRREKQIRQEELANHVGVSAQAVSKWENGGMPDTDLLPKIADFFGVSVDALFGRDPVKSGSLWRTLVEAVSGDDELTNAFNVCSMLVQAIGADESSEQPDPIILEDGLTSQSVSTQRGCGFARILVQKDFPYFLLMPDFSEKKGELYSIASLPALFRDLGDEKFFRALSWLMTRESGKAFTSNLLVKKLGFTQEETAAVIEKLKKYGLLSSSAAEIDEEETVMYKTEYSQSFAAMIRFARELPQPKTEQKG